MTEETEIALWDLQRAVERLEEFEDTDTDQLRHWISRLIVLIDRLERRAA